MWWQYTNTSYKTRNTNSDIRFNLRKGDAYKNARCVQQVFNVVKAWNFLNNFRIYKKVKLATVVEGDPKAPFLIATTPIAPFLGLIHFTLDPYLKILSVKQGGIVSHFWVFGMTRPGIEPRSPGPYIYILKKYRNKPTVRKYKLLKSINSEKVSFCNILTFDPAEIPFKVMHRKEVTHSNGSYERKSRGRKLVNKMGPAKKSHDTLIDWRTGIEWSLNCMTVISAWWRLNMRFQRSSGRSSGRELFYNSAEFESQCQSQ